MSKVTMNGIFVNGQQAVFHPENILSGDASAYTEEIGTAVEAWMEENVTGGEQVTDKTLTLPGVPADAKETGDQISAVKEELNAIRNISVVSISPTFVAGKYITSTGGLNNNAKRIATAEYVPLESDTIDYSVVEGYRMYGVFYDASKVFVSNTRNWLTGSGTLTVPEGAAYMRIGFASVGDEQTLTVEDASNLSLSHGYHLIDVLDDLDFNAMQFVGTVDNGLDNVYGQGLYHIPSGGTPADAPSGFSSGLLVVFRAYSRISATLKTYQTVQMLIDVAHKSIFARYCNTSNAWRDWWDIMAKDVIVEKTKWLAVGDSITYGVYSYITSGGTASNGVTNSCWVKLLAASMGYDLTTMASRGLGYAVTGQDPDDSSLPRIDLNELLTRIEALTDDFNLITLALGINDYATGTVTIANIKTNLTDAIQRLMTKFPNARLIVITPFNSAREGDASTNYAYNAPHGNRTLKDVADAIKEQCQAYGVECFYATNGFVFNNYNIEGLEPDNTHPSLVGHKLIAKAMAHILYN